jgi:LysM repeat protein
MRKIFISAGHSNKVGRDRGAIGNDFIEGNLTVELRNLIVNELKKLGNTPIVDGDNTVFTESINKFKSLSNPDSIVLDIHWNAATPKVTGVETLIPEEHTPFEVKLAESLSESISSTLNITKRGKNGVKTEAESHHGRLGWMRLIGENVLIEVCFITNKTDMTKYQNKKVELSKNLAKILDDFSKEITTNYIVVKGDTLSKIAKENNTTIPKLVGLNNMSSSNVLKIGQVLRIK